MNFLAEGLRRVWRRQRILWWLFVINLALAHLAILPINLRWGQVLDQSLAAEQLSRGFNVGRYIELTMRPEVGLGIGYLSMLGSSLIFFVFVLFVTGGILEAYRSGQKLTTAEFFQASGGFFWRLVRLLLTFLVVLVPIAFLGHVVEHWSRQLSDQFASDMAGFWIALGGGIIVLFLALVVRLWFDMAQVHAVATGERAMRRAVANAYRLTFGNFGVLFLLYVVPTIVAWIGLLVVFWVWAKWVPATAVGVSFVVLQLGVLLWIGTRLWQRAAETVWYQSTQVVIPQESAPEIVAR
jgi:hypothetical protein